MNINDRYYLNFDGLKERRTCVSRPLEKVYKSLMKDMVKLRTQEHPEVDPYYESKDMFLGMKESFPNFMPNLSKTQIESFTDQDIDIILDRLSKYNF